MTDVDRDAILQVFLTETDEGLSRLEESLVGLEACPGSLETLGDLFRTVHTLKGNAATLGIASVSELAHAVENVLDRLRSGRLVVEEGLISLLLRAVDALRHLVASSVAGVEESLPEHKAILELLHEETPKIAPAAAHPAIFERRLSPGRRREDIHAFIERRRTLRVDTSKLDRMLDITGEVAIARGRLKQLIEETADMRLSEAYNEMERHFVDLQEQVMKARMVPVGPVFRQFVRLARDVAIVHGKHVRLVVEGEGVEVDMTIIEHLKDPLTHIVRNAIDHGIENSDIRVARGKDACGTIVLSARHEAGCIVIKASDDGAGLDREAILSRAIARGIVSDTDRLPETEIDRLIFEPGFTTATTVTQLSGRGVGLDVVKRNVETLRGSVSIESRRDQGVCLTIRLPLTLAIIQGFGVGVAGETYLIPVDSVIECVDLPEDAETCDDGCGVFSLRGEPLPFIELGHHFGLNGDRSARQQVVVLRHAGGLAGIAVDTLFGETQTVIKPLGSLFAELPGIAGSTILGSGRIALILDVETLIQRVLEKTPAMAGRSYSVSEGAVEG